jgi:hypothetical protein
LGQIYRPQCIKKVLITEMNANFILLVLKSACKSHFSYCSLLQICIQLEIAAELDRLSANLMMLTK